MKKLVILLFLFFLCSVTDAENNLTIKWYGTTCLTISDGKTTLLFDPFVTRPSLFDFVTLRKVKSDPEVVKKWLGEDLKTTKAIFVSHTHYDHVLDLVNSAKRSSSNLYGSVSMKNIALGGSLDQKRIRIIKKEDIIKVGDFSIEVLHAFHPPHFLGFTLSSGQIKRPMVPDARAIDYQMDASFNFFIKHPRGNILFHPTPIPFRDLSKNRRYDSDIVLMGLASRKNDEDILLKIILPMNPKVFIPLHYDNFFRPLSKKMQALPFIRLARFEDKLKKKIPTMTISKLGYGVPLPFRDD